MLITDNLLHQTSEVLHNVWNYIIISVNTHDICVSNVVLASALALFGVKYFTTVLHNLRHYLHAKMGHDKDTVNALEKIIKYAICAVYVISVLEIANIPLSSFAFIGGALALGIGLGGQNLMSSFISSLIIMVERPIKIGDIVEIGGVVGTVTTIGARCISLTSPSNVEILVPNNKVMQHTVVNWTFADNIICSNAILRIAKTSHPENPRDVIKKLEELLESIPDIYKTPVPIVYLTDIDETHYAYRLSFSRDLTAAHAVESMHSEVNLALVDLLKGKEFKVEYLKLVPRASEKGEDDSKSPYSN